MGRRGRIDACGPPGRLRRQVARPFVRRLKSVVARPTHSHLDSPRRGAAAQRGTGWLEVLGMRVRLLALVSSVALFALAAAPASAASEGHDYLALGDSVPFGFSFLVNPNDASNFIGYPEIVAQRLAIKDVNATCPGEASGGFLSLTGTDTSCRPYRAAFPLHTQYNVSQMDYALRYLTGHKDTRLITLTMGANDLFRFQKDHPECLPASAPAICSTLLAGVFAPLKTNLTTIFLKLRSTGYSGLTVAVTYYALDYRDALGVFLTQLGQSLTTAAGSTFGVKIASGV